MSPATVLLSTLHTDAVLQQQALHECRVFTDGALGFPQPGDGLIELVNHAKAWPVERQRHGSR